MVDGRVARFPFQLRCKTKTARMFKFGRGVDVMLGNTRKAFALVFATTKTKVALIIYPTKGKFADVDAPRTIGHNGVQSYFHTLM